MNCAAPSSVIRLANGVRVVVDPMPGLESAALGVWVEAGARHEKECENGLAHLIEHMAFKGAGGRSAREIVEAVEARGGSLNAATGHERTSYYGRVLKDDVTLALDILADIVRKPHFDAQDFENERKVVLQEIGEARDQPDDLVFDRLQQTAWGDTPLGRPVAGTDASVGAMTLAQARDFHNRRFGPEALIIAAAGAVAEDAFVEQATRLFGDMAPRSSEDKVDRGAYRAGTAAAQRQLDESHLAIGWPAPSAVDDDAFAARALAEIYGGGMASRLFQKAREEQALSYSIYSFVDSYSDVGLLGVYAAAEDSDLPALTDVIGAELTDLAGGPTDSEVARAKAQMKAAYLMSRESPAARADIAARHTALFGAPLAAEDIVARIDAVDAPSVAAIACDALAHRASVSVVGAAADEAATQASAQLSSK